MAVYAVWNNKGGVGKSYLAFQIACEYAYTHPAKRVLVIDLCPQANCSTMLLGGIDAGEQALDSASQNGSTISGYIADRINSPYRNTNSGMQFAVQARTINARIPNNLNLVIGDEQLEVQMSAVAGLAATGPSNSWQLVHTWIRELISDLRTQWHDEDLTVFIDCNPSFTLFTEMAMSASDRLIIPFSADGSSKRAVRSVLSLMYGVQRYAGAQLSQFHINSQTYGMSVPKIYLYVGNRLTAANFTSANAFQLIVREIGNEIFRAWSANPNAFHIHNSMPFPNSRAAFRQMYQCEVRDANTASVVSSTLGIPLTRLTAGKYSLPGRSVDVNQSQLDVQIPSIRNLVHRIQ